MSTLGFGDITFSGDLGRLFSILVLLSGIIFLLVMLPFTFIQFFYAPWLEAQNKALAPRELPPGTRGHVIIIGPDSTALNLAQRLRHTATTTCSLPDVQTPWPCTTRLHRAVGDHDDPRPIASCGGCAPCRRSGHDVRNTTRPSPCRACATVHLARRNQKPRGHPDPGGQHACVPFTRMHARPWPGDPGREHRSGIIGRFD